MRSWLTHVHPLFLKLVGAALLIRLLLIPNPGFEADVSFWKSWGLATVDFGIVEGMKVTNNNYPTPFAYQLGAMVAIYKLFADPHNFNEFWKNTNLLFLTISKLWPILADLGIAGLILYIGKNATKLGFPTARVARVGGPPSSARSAARTMGREGKPATGPAMAGLFGLTFYEVLSVTYLLNPVVLMDGAWWGQVDSVGVFLFLGAAVLALKDKPLWAGAVFMVAMMTKLQNMIYGPIFFLFIWQRSGFGGLVSAAMGALVAFFGLNMEFVLSRNMDRVLASLTENYDYFPWMSLMAYNLWWIVTGAHGMTTSDKLTMVGLLNAKTAGLILFSSLYLFATVRQFLGSRRDNVPSPRVLFENLVVVGGAFFLFQTQSHDRYAFPITVFLLLLAPYVIARATKTEVNRLKLFAVFYAVFTLVYFYNLHTALVANYPLNGIPLLSLVTQPMVTITAAFLLLMLFSFFLMTLTPRIYLGIPIVTGIAGLTILNLPLITKKPVSLTKFTPYISEQQYGQRQTNRAVQSSFGGPYKWTRLSVQYLFYDKGIGTHANSRHVFDINRNFKRFTTDFGIDTEADTRASAVFEIYGDGRLLFRSEKMGRFDLPKHADVDVTGVKYLELKTTDAGDGNYDDHTDWLNPTLWP